VSLAHRGVGPDTLTLAIGSLFALATEVASTTFPGQPPGSSLAGYKFEDDAAKAAYEALTRVGVTPYPPRSLLQLPTLSGLSQQFDVVLSDGPRYYIVELKRRSHSEIEQLYAFVGKLLDYALAARLHSTGHLFTGIFVSTAPKFNDHFRQFALAYGIWPIAPDLTPCQVIHERTAHPGIRRDAADLIKAIDVSLPAVALTSQSRPPANTLLMEWQFLVQRQE
jgi:hypothetical protein